MKWVASRMLLLMISAMSIFSTVKPDSDFSKEFMELFENTEATQASKEQIKRSLCKALITGKRHKIAGAKIFSTSDSLDPNNVYSGSTFRIAHQDVYLWPSLTDHEKSVIREAFHQISRRTCLRFNELDYKPWYHAERWMEEKPYVVIRKSKKFTGYSDNTIEGINRRSLLYITESSLNHKSMNQSRGMVMAQLLRFMGYREENLRPDASSYIQSKHQRDKEQQRPHFSNEQLQWPFDPESVTIASHMRNTHVLTIYCQARKNDNIGAGQRAGLLTRHDFFFALEKMRTWDAVKLNSMYCPSKVKYADPRLGPCVLPRQRQEQRR